MWWQIGVPTAVVLLLAGLGGRRRMIEHGYWRPIQLGRAANLVGRPLLGSTPGGSGGDSRAFKVWMCNRSRLPQTVDVLWDKSRLLWPRVPKAQLAPRRFAVGPHQDGDVVLKFLNNANWGHDDADPQHPRTCWVWLVVQGRMGKSTRRLVKGYLCGPRSPLWGG